MPSIRSLVVVIFVSLAGLVPATAQQPHWLQGEWSGELSNIPANSRLGSGRTLTVTSVSPDGATAQGTWANSAGKVPVSIVIAGEAISFTTPGSAGATYKLTRSGDRLAGRWETIGASQLGGEAALKKK